MAARILITGQSFRLPVLKGLREQGFDVEYRPEHLDENALRQALVAKDAYVLGGFEFASAAALQDARGLKVISIIGVGYQTFVDVEAATRLGIAVTNNPGVNARAVAEMSVGFMLSMRRKMSFINQLTKTGEWRGDVVTQNLQGATLGLVGMGAIGRIVAQIAGVGLGMSLLYFSRNPVPAVEAATGAKLVPMDELLSSSDVVSLHCPLTPETAHLIGERELQLMKRSALLINTARPGLVNPTALHAALTAGTIAGCAMDGYYVEPAPRPEDDPYGLLRLSDEVFLITPHVAYLTEDSVLAMSQRAANSAVNFLEGRDGPHVVNPDFAKYRS